MCGCVFLCVGGVRLCVAPWRCIYWTGSSVVMYTSEESLSPCSRWSMVSHRESKSAACQTDSAPTPVPVPTGAARSAPDTRLIAPSPSQRTTNQYIQLFGDRVRHGRLALAPCMSAMVCGEGSVVRNLTSRLNLDVFGNNLICKAETESIWFARTPRGLERGTKNTRTC